MASGDRGASGSTAAVSGSSSPRGSGGGGLKATAALNAGLNNNNNNSSSLGIIHEENEWRRRASSVSSSTFTDSESEADPIKPKAAGLVVKSNPSEDFMDVLHPDWRIRKDRDALTLPPASEHSWVRRVLGFLSPDALFSLSRYKGGGMVGPPHSVGHMFGSKSGSAAVSVQPTQLASDSVLNESSVSVADAQGVYQLDPSLVQISKRMQELLKTIEGRCRMPAVRLLGFLLGKLFRMLFTRVEVDTSGVARARQELAAAAAAGSSVMLLPTHRSHVDYLLMSYVCFGFNLPTPHIAAGDNLNIPVVGPLFAYSGAFFLRRSFRGDNLYKKVLYGYLLRKLREGAPVEVFVEGGRSRTGMVSDPKLGMLVMAVRFVRDASVPDIVLLPASVDYERALETDEHVNQQLGSKKKGESLWGVLQSGWRLLTGSRYGKAYVNFAKGVSVKDELDKLGDASVPEEVCVQAVADAVVAAQRRSSFITPAALLSAALLACDDPLAADPEGQREQQRRLAALVKRLARLTAHSGARTVDVAHLDAKPDEFDLLLAHSFETITPLLEVEPAASSNAGSGHKKHKRRGRKGSSSDQAAAFSAASCSSVEATAKQRLRLRYCCGQLVPALAPYGCVAAALSALNRGPRAFVSVDELCAAAANVAQMVRLSLPGAQLDAATLRACVKDLVAAAALEQLRRGVRPAPTQGAADFLRCLRVLVAPSAAACCAALSVMAAPWIEHGAGAAHLEEAEPLQRARQVVLAQCLSKGAGTRPTDWALAADAEQQRRRNLVLEQQHPEHGLRRITEADMPAEANRLAPMVGFPEALSTVELKKAVANLAEMSVLGRGLQPQQEPQPLLQQASTSPLAGSSASSTGSMASLLPFQQQQLQIGARSTVRRNVSSSQFSVISVASSVSLLGFGDVDESTLGGGSAENKSNDDSSSSEGDITDADGVNTSNVSSRRTSSASPTHSVGSAAGDNGNGNDNDDQHQVHRHQQRNKGKGTKHRRQDSGLVDASASAAQAAAAAGHVSGKELVHLTPTFTDSSSSKNSSTEKNQPQNGSSSLRDKLASLQRLAFRGELPVPGHAALATKAKALYASLAADIRASEDLSQQEPGTGMLSWTTLGATVLASGALVRILRTWQNRFNHV